MRIKVLSGGRKSIELPLSDAELNFQMKRIGIEETVPVCRLVEASEKDNPLCKFEGQTVNMDEVNFFAKRLDCLTEYERKVLYSYVTDYGVGTMQDLINLTFSMKGLSLITDFSDAEQVGKRLYLDEFIAMSEEEKQQTNFIKFAEKTFKESRVEVLPYGVFVEHGFEMQEVYNGKTFPEYFASDEIVAAIEVQNQAGDTEYLYLPTDICSMNKVKERLQVMDFWEMKVTDIHNIRLPDILVPMPENIDCVEALTLFNETCQAVRHFDEVQMKQLAMVVEFTGFSSPTVLIFSWTSSNMNGGTHRMSKKNMESTRELMGTREVTDYSIRTYRNEELVYFLIQPSNISVLSEESLSARIYGLMTVLKGITEIEMMCLNSRENFEDNKRYLKKRMEEETNPTVRKLLEKDANYLDRMQVQMATAREFLLIIRLRNQKENEIFSYLNRIEKMLTEQGFTSKRAEEEDIRRILAVYFEQNVTTEKFEEFDGERWIILND